MHVIAPLAFAVFAISVLETSGAHAEERRNAPSFDCSKALQDFEKAICSNSDLSALDVELDALYRAFPSDDPARRAHQVWNGLRKDCGFDADCIFDLQMHSYSWLGGSDDWKPWLREAAKTFKRPSRLGRGGGDLGWGFHLPKVKGGCTQTALALIRDRFGGDPNAAGAAGVSALFGNGGAVISYDHDHDRVLLASRISDPVEMCLASIPVGCPLNDQRGREYTVTNLRTHGRTMLADSQHACGGP